MAAAVVVVWVLRTAGVSLTSRRGAALGASTFSLCFSLTQQTIRIRNVALEVTDTYLKKKQNKNTKPLTVLVIQSPEEFPLVAVQRARLLVLSLRPETPGSWRRGSRCKRLINRHRCRLEAAQLLKRPLNRQWSEEGGESLDFGQSAGQK